MKRASWIVALMTCAPPVPVQSQQPAAMENRSRHCEAAPAVWEEVLDAAAVDLEREGKIRPEAEVHAERVARMTALLAKYPREFHVRLAYLTYSKRRVASDQLLEEFQKSAAANPGDSGAQYLFAEALTGKRTSQAIPILEDVARKDPEFPWPYWLLASIYRSPAFADQTKAQANASAFIERCPATAAAVSLAGGLDGSERLEALARLTRERISGKRDRETVKSYSPLWRLEFKITPVPEHARVRLQIKHDLRFLETLDRRRHRNLRSLLAEGYKLAGDADGLARLSASASTTADLIDAYLEANNAWHAVNREPPTESAAGVRQAFFRKYVEFLNEWTKKVPALDSIAVQRLDTLAELPDTPPERLTAEGERALELHRQHEPYPFSMFSTPESVAQVWARRGVALDRIPNLLREGEAAHSRQEAREAGPGGSDLFRTPGDAIREENARWIRKAASWETLAIAYTKSGRSEAARAELSRWAAALDGRRGRAASIRASRANQAAGGTTSGHIRRHEDDLVNNIGFEESRYYSALAELARAETRTNDALSMYQSAVRALASSERAPAGLAKSEPAVKARELWRLTGGTDEGWQLWFQAAVPLKPLEPARSHWRDVTKTLPGFALADQNGTTWTLRSLKGKTTLLNVWATWCGPCRFELPHVQELHERIKARRDIQVVTLNVDESAGLVQPYLSENQFTFPVLPGHEFVDELVGPLAIPVTWIADHDGKLRSESTGFGGDGERWIASAIAELERVAGSKPK